MMIKLTLNPCTRTLFARSVRGVIGSHAFEQRSATALSRFSPANHCYLANQPLAAAASIPTTRAFHGTPASFLAEETHNDFAPKRKEVGGDEDEVLKMIASHVKDNRIMLYMKGTPSLPLCGFSARVVDALKKEGADFSSVNVLDYPQIREGIKKFSEWPTIPQLFVNGEFIGGCDIVMAMHESGELKELLEEKKS